MHAETPPTPPPFAGVDPATWAAMPEGGLTTYEKLQQAVRMLRSIAPADMPADAREVIGGLQMAAGVGFDVFDLVLPADPADADVMIDKALALLLGMRGDDLPPFDPATV